MIKDYNEYINSIPYVVRLKQQIQLRIRNIIIESAPYRIQTTEEDCVLSIQKVQQKLKQEYRIDNWQFKVEYGYNDIPIIFSDFYIGDMTLIVSDIQNNQEIIQQVMEDYGYFLNWKTNITDNDSLDWIVMIFHPIHTNDINNIVKQNKTILHITNTSNEGSIKKNGFIPSSKSKLFKYPKRVYFFLPMMYDDCVGFAEELYRCDQTQGNEYSIFYISTKSLDCRFEYDPNIEGGIYTDDVVENIHIYKIEHITL